mmetsp:Transcript_55285/g.124556  ORF Transcript_55285/g.124556 Transcript_55285/m.124556 type:complete len:204 (+) Transcript_55285:449-1060(+)
MVGDVAHAEPLAERVAEVQAVVLNGVMRRGQPLLAHGLDCCDDLAVGSQGLAKGHSLAVGVAPALAGHGAGDARRVPPAPHGPVEAPLTLLAAEAPLAPVDFQPAVADALRRPAPEDVESSPKARGVEIVQVQLHWRGPCLWPVVGPAPQLEHPLHLQPQGQRVGLRVVAAVAAAAHAARRPRPSRGIAGGSRAGAPAEPVRP